MLDYFKQNLIILSSSTKLTDTLFPTFFTLIAAAIEPKNRTISGSKLSFNAIETIESITAKLLEIDNVDSITSILNVPILLSPPRPITELVEYIPTLKSQNIDLDLVKKEFISSPLYSDNLVSTDFKTTSIIINLKEDKLGLKIRDERNLLREKNIHVSLSDNDLAKLDNLETRYTNHKKNN